MNVVARRGMRTIQTNPVLQRIFGTKIDADANVLTFPLPTIRTAQRILPFQPFLKDLTQQFASANARLSRLALTFKNIMKLLADATVLPFQLLVIIISLGVSLSANVPSVLNAKVLHKHFTFKFEILQ